MKWFLWITLSSVDGARHLLMRVVIIASSTPAWVEEGMKIAHIWNHGFLKRTYHLVKEFLWPIDHFFKFGQQMS